MAQFQVNGTAREIQTDLNTPILWALREELGLTGTKFGCGIAACGACTIHINGVAVRSCVTPLSEAVGKHITTIEGLGTAKNPHPLQMAWIQGNVPQCGYCQSGQLMSAAALLAAKPQPTSDEIDVAMSGNICRCGTYLRIKKAILSVAGGH